MASTVTYIRRGAPIRNAEGKVVGYEKGESKTYKRDSKFIISAEGRTKREDKAALIERRMQGQPKTLEESLARKQATQPVATQQPVNNLPYLTSKNTPPEQLYPSGYGSRNPVIERLAETQRRVESGQINKTKQRYAPSVVDRDFYTVPGQKAAGERFTVGTYTGVAKTISKIPIGVPIAPQLGTFNITLPGADKKLTAETRITGEKGGLLLEMAANDPLTTAAIAAAPFSALKVGAVKGAAGIAARGVNTLVVGTGVAGGVRLLATGSAAVSSAEAAQLRTPELRQAIGETYREERSRATGFSGFAQDVTLLAGSKRGFEQTLRINLIEKGYSGDKLETAVSAGLKAREIGGVSEVAGFVAANAGAESTGRFAQNYLRSQALNKGLVITGFGKSATVTAAAVIPAGFAEAFSQSIVQDQSRFQDVSVNRALVYGGLGAVSAGVVAGLIGGAAGANMKSLKATTEFIANIADPYEFPGDITATAAGRVGRSLSPVITLTPTFSSSPAFTSSPVTQSPSPVNMPIFVSTPLDSNVFSTKPNTNIPSITQTPVSTTVITPTPTPTPTPVPSITNINTNLFTNTPISSTSVNTNTFTNTFTTTVTPTVTSKFVFIPPFSLGGGGGFGSLLPKTSSKGKRKKGTPASLIGLSFGIGEKTTAGRLYSGLGIRQ